jgi:hypothetical protein
MGASSFGIIIIVIGLLTSRAYRKRVLKVAAIVISCDRKESVDGLYYTLELSFFEERTGEESTTFVNVSVARRIGEKVSILLDPKNPNWSSIDYKAT